MEHISNKIDDLSEMMRRLSHERSSTSGLATSAGLQPPLHSSLRSSESRVAASDNKTGVRDHHQPLAEAGGIESTLFAHVIFATKFLQTVVANDPYSNVAADMTSVLDALRSTVNVQRKKNETLEGSPPFSKALPPGLSSRDLPMPSMNRILACLRIAHEERSPNQVYWPFEFGSLGDFTQYVIKACSPGPVTDTELIIVHYGLELLFTECSSVAGDDAVKQEYEAQAFICSDSLETILSNLPFHITTNIVSVCAMYMAALGLHNKLVMATEPTEESQRGMRLFWALYALEKAVSLRLGRSSTIRDHDITVPRLLLDRKMTSLLHNRLPDWIEVASLYGRVLEPCPQCISAARATLKEIEVCISMLADAALWSPNLDIWVNEIILLAPFMPFLILFCSIIETSNSSDLDRLRQLVDSLQSMAQSPRYSACSKQLRILKALYDVAAKYVEAKAKGKSGDVPSDPFTDLDMDMYLKGNAVWFDADPHSPGLLTAPETWSVDGVQTPAAASSAGTTEDQGQQVTNQALSFQPRATISTMQQQIPDDFTMELDTPGVQLGSWFHQSHQMMRLLDDS
ncbi:hypothetical protein PENSOL_c075G11179 [Penicillium solitum]|uniref:Xylanolytic transcriptional activator regulatory domain-containing protein n=1 Tax=Penicillium solitum TaxID=60172 RepID=A0A1V6QFC5_9EURO|nr:uncharacterized protein PENSOL_c075G11179 [Penicillium solitum]OQD87920.1 hypothetical protein PENSOL_c075G11179 [Penicillium solitum]